MMLIIFWINILVFSLPLSKMVVAKCLKLMWNHSGIISGTYFSPFQGVYYLYRGLRRAPKSYFGLILDFWIILLIFCEWIILLNILDSIEWIFFWMNILDFVFNWIIFRPNEKMNFQNGSARATMERHSWRRTKTNPLFLNNNNNNLLPTRPWFNSDGWKIE